MRHFVELRAWQEARAANKRVYAVTRDAFRGDRDLARQLRRASVSVMANIAEGFGRFHHGERMQFFRVALGSSHETQSHLYVAHDAGFLSGSDLTEIFELHTRTQNYLGAFMRALQPSPPDTP